MDDGADLVSGKPSRWNSVVLVDKDPAAAARNYGDVVTGGPDGEGRLLAVVDLHGEGVSTCGQCYKTFFSLSR